MINKVFFIFSCILLTLFFSCALEPFSIKDWDNLILDEYDTSIIINEIEDRSERMQNHIEHNYLRTITMQGENVLIESNSDIPIRKTMSSPSHLSMQY